MLEQEQGLARVLRKGDRGEVEEPAHGEGLEGEADAEHVGEDGLERPRPAPAPLEEDERRVAQPQRYGRVPGAPGGGGHRGSEGGEAEARVGGWREFGSAGGGTGVAISVRWRRLGWIAGVSTPPHRRRRGRPSE